MSAAPPLLFNREVRSVHCLGIGGMGVGPLAIYLARRGFRVTGEDDALTAPMRTQLERAGVTVTGAGEIPEACDLVVYSSAISAQHPGHRVAGARGLARVRRGELLAEVARDRRLVAVCGSHGKTTTTAMLASALRAAGFAADYVLGGLPNDETMPPAGVAAGDVADGGPAWAVAEIDESDGTIAAFTPEIAVVVNLDWDHPDHYRKQADLEAAFTALMKRTRRAVLVNACCDLSRRLAQPFGAVTFGEGGDYAAKVASDSGRFLALALGGRFPLDQALVGAGGAFNAANATAALAAAHLMGAPLSRDLLAAFPGVRRRQAALPAPGGVSVVEDYAHHPAEIRALLANLRARVDVRGRLRVVFQPHRFSRTAQFLDDFAGALGAADTVHLLDVYGAGEAPREDGTTARLRETLAARHPSLLTGYVPGDPAATLDALMPDLAAGDLLAFVGAGDIDRHARLWLDRFRVAQAEGWEAHAAALRAAVSPATAIRREEPLAPKTTLRVGGAARLYAEPAGIDDLRALLRAAHARKLPVRLLGRGSNLLVPDEGVEALVISLRQPAWETFEPLSEGRVRVGAGLRLKNLCGLAVKAGLAGFEFLEGIPGNVGGALRMNAGAMGGWMFDVVESVDVMTFAGESRTLRREEMHVDYRHCAELHDAIALGAILRPASTSEAASIARQIDVYKDKRQKSQPREPSAGCIFKNPSGDSAGRLIDVTGLKGERVGDAEVSPVHANFIVNRGRATSDDVIALVRRVRARVEAAQGVRLEPEVLLYGREWGEVL
jgi:UDP-N-acetylenolpyruvoylglucosamine reductase